MECRHISQPESLFTMVGKRSRTGGLVQSNQKGEGAEGCNRTVARVGNPRISGIVEYMQARTILRLPGCRVLCCLFDTGARAQEVMNMKLEDLDQVSGSILIRKGKGSKPRVVFLGKKSRKLMRRYLIHRKDRCEFLFVGRGGEPITYWGLRQIILRRCEKAGIPPVRLHDFRRGMALNFLRNSGDVFSLQLLMGHADLQVLRRYLKETTADLRAAHLKAGPVDMAG